jgi:ppGpp synthetase/RelA/SpoT-type nucleotidyltranferase
MALSEEDKKFIGKNIPEPYNTPERFSEFILPKIQVHDVLCTTTKATVTHLLAPLIKKHGNRFFCRIDDTHQQKNPESIIDKIRRSQAKQIKAGESESAGYNLDNFSKKMTDLARFRVVCNFLSDVESVAQAIESAEELKRAFNIEKKSTLRLRHVERKSGDRSVKLILQYKRQPDLFLEIQVMTQLQEAWDKKDHFLVYEPRRSMPDKDEENFPDYLDAKMFAMAELLDVADQYFDQLRGTRKDKNIDEDKDETPK